MKHAFLLSTTLLCALLSGCADDSDDVGGTALPPVDSGTTPTDTGTTPPADTGSVTPPGDADPDAPKPETCSGSAPVEEVVADITANTEWTCAKTYVLKKFVEVKPGATLTIKAGTVIKGVKGTGSDSITGLAVLPGAKINAMGTKTQPIVMTSNEASPKRGDWAGLMLLGKAKSNHQKTDGSATEVFPEGLTSKPQFQYGSLGADRDDADSSGELHFVRVEWAGFQLTVGNEINSFSFYGVGSGTKLDHLESIQGFDDAFEWFGGTVSGKYLLAQSTNDDCFDMDNGYSGKLQYLICNRDDVDGGGNGFEVDNDANGSNNQPYTNPTIWNATLIGKTGTATTEGGHGAHIRRNARGKWSNILAVNWPLSGLNIEANLDASKAPIPGSGCEKNVADGALVIQNSNFSGATKDGNNTFSSTFLGEASRKLTTKKVDEAKITDIKSTGASFALQAGSPFLTGGAAPPADGFFDAAGKDLIGACGTTCPEFEGWTVFK